MAIEAVILSGTVFNDNQTSVLVNSEGTNSCKNLLQRVLEYLCEVALRVLILTHFIILFLVFFSGFSIRQSLGNKVFVIESLGSNY